MVEQRLGLNRILMSKAIPELGQDLKRFSVSYILLQIRENER